MDVVWLGVPHQSHTFSSQMIDSSSLEPRLQKLIRFANSYGHMSILRVNASIFKNHQSPLVKTLWLIVGLMLAVYWGLISRRITASKIGRKKKKVFGFVVDKVRNKIQSWKNMFLSIAGKEILIKSVAQAVPNYVISVRLPPPS